MNADWAIWEDETLLAVNNLHEVAAKTGRTYAACKQRRGRLQDLGQDGPRPMRRGTKWTPEMDQMLISMRPTSMMVQIAAAISRAFRVTITKNSIVGRSARLGLESKKAPRVPRPPRKPRPKTYAKARPGDRRLREWYGLRPPKLPTVEPTTDYETDRLIPDAQRKTFFGLENCHCRWPVGEPGSPEFFFCGHPSANFNAGEPYCEEHKARSMVGVGEPIQQSTAKRNQFWMVVKASIAKRAQRLEAA